MRRLVACPRCRRQYDATELPVGSRFHCHCTAVVEITLPRGHDAAVVRCSSCGAPRSAGAETCAFCGSDFTLHERDLHTICPQCLARISDRAKFCHHCATQIMPLDSAWQASDRHCPACGGPVTLHHRQLGEPAVAALECPRCAGLWLPNGSFDHLAELNRRIASGTGARSTPRRIPQPPEPREQKTVYRSCPQCQALMHRRNFGRKSGVIVDVCAPHGLWFDAEELTAIATWIRAGGEARADRQLRQEEAAAARQRRFQSTLDDIGTSLEPSNASVRGLGELLTWLLS